MKKLLAGTLLLALALAPVPTMAGSNIGFSLSLPSIVFESSPELVVLPGTNIYVAPDVDAEIFFYNGWWWRPSQGRWYRSRNYDAGWSHYQRVPSFYRQIPSGWRNDYRHNRWQGREWHQQRTPYHNVQRNWNQWEKSRYWEKQNNWGVRDSNQRDRDRGRDRDNRQDRQDRRDRRDYEQERNNRNERLDQQEQKIDNQRERLEQQEQRINNRNQRLEQQERKINNQNEQLQIEEQELNRLRYREVERQRN
ncbi:MAG: hypothetical protein HQK70_14165 [Desulfamplus sp.]|nr:hypothetical protein [Desulfamplus sp.]